MEWAVGPVNQRWVHLSATPVQTDHRSSCRRRHHRPRIGLGRTHFTSPIACSLSLVRSSSGVLASTHTPPSFNRTAVLRPPTGMSPNRANGRLNVHTSVATWRIAVWVSALRFPLGSEELAIGGGLSEPLAMMSRELGELGELGEAPLAASPERSGEFGTAVSVALRCALLWESEAIVRVREVVELKTRD